MNPEERQLLEKTLKLSEENNHLLKKINRRARWAAVWGFVKLALIIVPLIIGYIFLQPYLDQASGNLNNIKELFNAYRSFPI